MLPIALRAQADVRRWLQTMATRIAMHLMLFAVLVTSNLGCGRFLTPSDAVMQQRFQENRADFERLVQMLRADTGLYRITHRLVEHMPPGSQKITRDREREYRQLMGELGIDTVSAVHREVGDFSFRVRAFTSGGGMGYSFCEKVPYPLVKQLDGYRPATPGSFSAYREIEDHWYIYLSRGL